MIRSDAERRAGVSRQWGESRYRAAFQKPKPRNETSKRDVGFSKLRAEREKAVSDENLRRIFEPQDPIPKHMIPKRRGSWTLTWSGADLKQSPDFTPTGKLIEERGNMKRYAYS